MYRVLSLTICLIASLPNIAMAEKLYACIEKAAAGFDADQQMKPSFFKAERRFILKFNQEDNTFTAQEMYLSRSLFPITCEPVPNPETEITCMSWSGSVVMGFNPQTKQFRWVAFGNNGEDTVLSHGSCEDF